MNRARDIALCLVCASACRLWTLASATGPGDAGPDGSMDSGVERQDAATIDVPTEPASTIDVPTLDLTADLATVDAALPPIDCAAERAAIVGSAGRFSVGSNLHSPLVVTTPHACPLLVTAEGRPFAGFATRAAGRVVVLGHDSALTQFPSDTAFQPLLSGVVRWLGRRELPRLGVDRASSVPALVEWWMRRGGAVQSVSPSELRAGSVDVWVSLGTSAPTGASEQAAVRAFVDSGGGVLIAGQSWAWTRVNQRPAAEYPANALLPDLGLLLAAVAMTVDEASVGASVLPPAYAHADAALARLDDHLTGVSLLRGGDPQGVARVLGDAVDHLPVASAQLDRGRRLAELHPPAAPNPSAPLIVGTAPVAALLHRVRGRVLRDGPLAWVEAVGALTEFPGSVTAAPVRRSVTVEARAFAREATLAYADAQATQWRSTGLYALPGRRVTIEVPPGATGAGLGIQIGVHDRALWPESGWSRPPEMLRRVALDRAMVVTANPYGGPIEVRVPVGADLGPVTLTIDGAAESPDFSLGVTDASAWRQRVAQSGVPWASLSGRTLRLVVPTSSARAVTDPTALLNFWDEVMDAMADLAGTPRTRERSEVVVFDRQIAGGGTVDAGYPTTRALSIANLATDLSTLRRTGDWGTFYGLGELHVSRDWLIVGAEDAAPNLFNLYAFERVLGVRSTTEPPPHAWLTTADRALRRRRYDEQGRNFARDWNSFTALETYLQVIETLGYRVFTDAFVAIRGTAPSERPRDNAGRVQLWVVRVSNAARLDLSPFHDAWAFPLTAATRATTRALPSWNRPAPLP